MSFFEKIKVGMMSPKKIALVRKERTAKTVIFLMFLIFITMIPTAIDIIKFNRLDSFTKNEVINDFVKAGGVDCAILGNTLECSTSEPTKIPISQFEMMFLVFDDTGTYSPKIGETSFVFSKTGILLAQGTIIIPVLGYESIPEFQGIDFNDSSSRLSTQFWGSFFSVVDNFVQQNKIAIILVGLPTAYIALGINFMIFALFVSLIFYMFNSVYKIKFGEIFNINSVALVPYVFMQLLSSLLGIAFIFYIGMVMSIFYALSAIKHIIENSEHPRKEDGNGL